MTELSPSTIDAAVESIFDVLGLPYTTDADREAMERRRIAREQTDPKFTARSAMIRQMQESREARRRQGVS